MNRFQWIFIKSPDFSEITDIQEIKELSDFSQFSKESLLPFGVLALKIIYIHKMSRFQCFGHDKGLMEQISVWILHIYPVFWQINTKLEIY